ncbi:peptidoglycan-binding protein [Actinoplanes sp. KI2]|uniref:peptidoglycan-binding domain-containing protein n=1 Tax=Actinoplanes sp. KI2 TaxID=2983315 RepID=UPI0021D59EFD|nr:peptidoglycan-binding domain-containing protein [Actinoplanes sp. KI2]MCU7723034.1 peptidoglycan-binding protein [Actinoplanes sp. KI2]
MSRRRGVWIAGVAVLVAAAAGTGSTYAVLTAREHNAERPAVVDPAPGVATVTRMTLSTVATVAGQLGHGTPEPIVAKAAGTLTWLPPVGTVLRRGDPVLRADERPVVVFYGDLPMYRPLALNSKGDDVEQFERNLADLGYGGFTVDQEYSDRTVAAVKRWQRDLQLPQTGSVDVQAVIYVAGPVRVAKQSVRVGAAAAGEVLDCTPDTKVVIAQVPAAQAAWAVRGAKVKVALPNGKKVDGVVRSVGTDAESEGDGGDGSASSSGGNHATVAATITIADQAAIGRLDSGPAQITYTVKERRDVLTVPVSALVAPIEGGYAVELMDGGDRLVPVTTGLFADGRVEITGDGVTEGAQVRVPS